MNQTLNQTLSQDIEKELLYGNKSQRIQEAVLQQQEGTIEIHVRFGRHQKTTPPPINLLEEEGDGGLKYSSFKDMVTATKEVVRKMDQKIDVGRLILSYRATNEGTLKYFNVFLKDVVYHTN